MTRPICSISACAMPVKAKGLCCKHWKRQYVGKPVDQPSCYDKLLSERFWEKVAIAGPDDCWLWKGGTWGTEGREYGCFAIDGKHISAHRLAWIFTNGEITKVSDADYRGTCVLHRCDTPLCCNPDHLFLGSHRENMKDKMSKGRDRGSRTTHCKRGHELSGRNVYRYKRNGTTYRHCRACHRMHEACRRDSARSQVTAA